MNREIFFNEEGLVRHGNSYILYLVDELPTKNYYIVCVRRADTGALVNSNAYLNKHIFEPLDDEFVVEFAL